MAFKLGGLLTTGQGINEKTGQQAGGGINHQANFASLFAEDPRLAYHYTQRNGPGLWNQMKGGILSGQFGGDMNAYNNWINTSDYGNISDQERWRLNDMWGIASPDRPGGAAATGGAEPAMGATTPATGGVDPYVPAGTASATATSPIGGASNIAGGFGATGGMDLNINQFLDPSMQFRINEGLRGLESSAAARGMLSSGSTLKGIQNYAQNIAGQEYGNAVQRAMADRSFRTGVDQNDRDFMYGALRDDRNFNFDRDRYNQEFGYRAQTGDRDYNFMRDTANRNFDYGAMVGDRDFNYRTLSDIARMGLSGAGGQSNLTTTLAQILNGNIMAGGNAGAAGEIGQSNAINNLITQLLNQMNQNQIIGNLGGG